MKPLCVPGFGVAKIFTESSGFYQPCEDGQRAIVLGVQDRHGATSDLCAWFPGKPGRWWVRRGAEPILGAGEVERASFLGLPLRLIATPEEWLFAHTEQCWPAATILDWRLDPCPTLIGIDIVCDNNALEARLRLAERRRSQVLRISVARPGGDRVAA